MNAIVAGNKGLFGLAPTGQDIVVGCWRLLFSSARIFTSGGRRNENKLCGKYTVVCASSTQHMDVTSPLRTWAADSGHVCLPVSLTALRGL